MLISIKSNLTSAIFTASRDWFVVDFLKTCHVSLNRPLLACANLGPLIILSHDCGLIILVIACGKVKESDLRGSVFRDHHGRCDHHTYVTLGRYELNCLAILGNDRRIMFAYIHVI